MCDGENLEPREKKKKEEAIYLVTISLQRRNFSSELHDAPITPAKIFQQEIFLIARNPEMIVRCLSSSSISCNITAWSVNIMR